LNSDAAELDSENSRGKSRVILAALVLTALWFVLCRHLGGEWSVNEQYSYGWFVPFFAAFLFWLRWESKPEVGGRRSEVGTQKSEVGGRKGLAMGIAVVALLLLFPVRLFEVANPDWRPVGWVHAFAVIAITFVVLYHAGGWPWVKHFSFPILFFLVAVPWISLIEGPIVQGLMRIIASLAAETVSLCGIPAEVQGNLIRISSGVVGVNEACSGVRSLQTSIMIGLLFGELKRLSVRRRLVLLAGAIAIALVANLGRAIFLVWIASTREVSAVDRWHDVAGYAIVGVVFLGSLGLTALLTRRRREVESRKEKLENAEQKSDLRPLTSVLRSPHFLLPTFYFLLSIAWLLAIEVGVEGWYRVHEKELTVVGSWNVRPPEKAPGFREIKIDESVRQTLRFDEGREVIWKSGAPGASTTNYLFFFRWNPGSSTVLRARAHRPDICLPSIGWTQLADLGAKNYPGPGNTSIIARHVTFKQGHGNSVAHTFFCLQEDKIHRQEARPDLLLAQGIQPDWSLEARMRVVREGIRNLGQQVLETVLISSAPMDDAAAEARFGELVRDVVVAEESRK
jgi:exosortase